MAPTAATATATIHSLRRSRILLILGVFGHSFKQDQQGLERELHIPEEKDLLQQLQRPVVTTATAATNNNVVVVAPQPVRPVGSSISVGCINEDATMAIQDQNLKRKQEVEDEVETETLPAIITDSKNRVRMVNSSYKELVGQPECPWLESMVTSIQCGSSAPSSTPSSSPRSSSPRSNKRISGEVALQVCDDSIKIPDSSSSNGFSCWVRIEWQSSEDQRKKFCVNAFCDVTKLCCESRDYVFIIMSFYNCCLHINLKAINSIFGLREALATLKALYETEVDEMRFEGLLDQALLHMQDEFEAILLSIKHKNLGDMSQLQYDDDENNNDTNNELVNNNFAACELGSELEVEVLRRISFTLAANDCLDICIDIYVKVRYRRAAKALMKLNPDYLKTYTPEGIDEMEWETLESAITLWTQHFQVAVRKVLKSEKSLCQRVLGTIMDGLVWPECFVKISDKIMAVFFRFGEGVARSSKEPQKLFKLLDMFESLERLKEHVLETFEGESGVDICTRFRELEKLIIDASSKVFWEFGLQIEGNADGLPPPQDGSVPKLVRYAINYLKYLASENYRTSMAKVLRTEQIWKNGILSKQETDESLLKNAISNVMEALERNIESKRSRCRDKILVQVFLMNTYWYIYMRTKNTELGELLGDQYMKIGYKTVAEESAYLYQKQSWGVLVAILDGGDVQEHGKDSIGRLVNEKMESFFKCLNEVCERHIRGGYSIPDLDLREQMRESTMKLVVPAYVEFLESYSGFLQRKMYPSPDKLRGMVRKAFDGGEGRPRRRGSTSNDRNAGGNSASLEGDIRDLRPSRSNSQDV